MDRTDISRRGMIGLTLASLVSANPLVRALASTTPQNHQVQVDFYVENIPDDPLSQSFYQDENHGLFVPITEKVREFYAGIGQEYGLPGVDLTFNLSELTDGNYPNLGKNHLAVTYLDLKTVDLMTYHRSIGSEESYTARKNETIEEFILLGVEREEAEEIVEANYRQGLVRRCANSDGVIEGVAFIERHRAILMPSSFLFSVSGDSIVKYFSDTLIHELGHLFSLDHPEEEFAKTSTNNLMGLTDYYRLLSATREQVQQINDYLNQGE